ncbi:MAG: 4Fe-4S dicluster domain-containing protein [Methanosarcinales archaeon]|nr:MAG: 4Fe-4S dicluster domain-containing protein [Methanosarcinales archaeon]
MKMIVRISSAAHDPVLAKVILSTGVAINVDRADLDATSGEIVLEVPADSCARVANAFEREGASVAVLEHPIIRDNDECVHCGACIGICPVNVFTYEPDWSVAMDESKCIQCGTCITACPHDALTIEIEPE